LPEDGQYLFLGVSVSSCHRLILHPYEEDRTASLLFKFPPVYCSGLGSRANDPSTIWSGEQIRAMRTVQYSNKYFPKA
jgi:hypothetical protein